MFSFLTLFSMLPTAITDVETILANPAVQSLEALIAANFTHTTTPGNAAIIEPITPAPTTATTNAPTTPGR